MPEPGVVAVNLERVLENISAAARGAGRGPESVRLVAVSKFVTAELVVEALRAGARDLGENRVQEGIAKRTAVEAALPEGQPPPRWHLIGHLQTNKASRAARSFDLVHSVDSLRVAEALSEAFAGRPSDLLGILLEVNVSGEESKYGVAPDQAASLARAVSLLPGLALRGLMTVAPIAANPEDVRPVFRRLAALRRELEALRLPGASLEHLSMGMSQDYHVAVAEGATLVRVGTAIFGPRGG